MEFKFQGNLDHQITPVMNVADVVAATHILPATAPHRNPVLSRHLDIQAIQNVWRTNNMPKSMCRYVNHPNVYNTKKKGLPEYQMMDIKMETGTGKTYVYTQTIYELHKRFGMNKFVIVVPTLPIKAGTASFVDDPAVKRHFKDVCGYHAEIELCLIEAQKKKKKGRQNIPSSIGHFFYGTKHEKNKIYVMLFNIQLLSRSDTLLTRADYDQLLGDFHCPINAIRDTCPVLIIDEPHRMKRDDKSFVDMIQQLSPQLVLRYGATFPEVTIGSGKKAKKLRDYVNLLYDLNAYKSFEDTLIKGIAKEHVKVNENDTSPDKMVRVTSINGMNKTVTLHYKKGNNPEQVFVKQKDDVLNDIDTEFGDLRITGITSNEVELSNGLTLNPSSKFYPDQYAASYQEAMMKLALKRHFETEREMFLHSPTRIKTLALFFIDNIDSFRGIDGKNDGWLRLKFLELLGEQVLKELVRKDNNTEYSEYLQATLDNIEFTCAGYFSQDQSESKEAIAQEVKEILHGKKQLLSFKNEDGSWNVRRFLFSKWTLKEGWDNPNVFTICKLRSSGSETSKLQEVGRGLRLPVDEEGNRIVDKSFMLNYIVDFTEKDFAAKLVAEINGDMVQDDSKPLELTDAELETVAKTRGVTADELFDELRAKKYIDRRYNVSTENLDAFLKDYPEFKLGGAGTNRIINRNSERKATVKIRKALFEDIRHLWKILNHKYVLYFDKEIESGLTMALPNLIKEKTIFANPVASTSRNVLTTMDGIASQKEAASTQIAISGKSLRYNEFLKRVSRYSHVPLKELHNAILKASRDGVEVSEATINEGSAIRLINAIDGWKMEHLQGLVRYKQAHYTLKSTSLTNTDGSVRDEVAQAYIGRMKDADNVLLSKKYLYEALVYDSPLERKNIMESDIEEVIVYGKIPSSSICIPTIASSNYSPDFMYVVKKSDGTKELNVVIETKAYDRDTEKRSDENIKIKCARQFFTDMQKDGYTVHFQEQLNGIDIKQILEGLIS